MKIHSIFTLPLAAIPLPMSEAMIQQADFETVMPSMPVPAGMVPAAFSGLTVKGQMPPEGKEHAKNGRNQSAEMLELLKKAVTELTNSQSYIEYLKAMSKFSQYSHRNSLLIYTQCPKATLVAGFSTWKKEFGRHVKKGEKAIKIFAPCTYSVDVEDEAGRIHKEKRQGYRRVSVFDISQTDGPPLPEPKMPLVLEGGVEHFQLFLEAYASCTDYTIRFEDLKGPFGTCNYRLETIFIQKNLSQQQTLKTLAHEAAHSLLHQPDTLDSSRALRMIQSSSPLREIEAESCSFIVCHHFGIDCSEYSFPYIALWKKQEDFFQESLERIARTSSQMIAQIEDYITQNNPVS